LTTSLLSLHQVVFTGLYRSRARLH
jgi:hypothetical protein